MSLLLNQGTHPDGLQVKTYGIKPEVVFLGDYRISMPDFLAAVRYVLTNTDLDPHDHRLAFVRWVAKLGTKDGWNEGDIRLAPRQQDCQR